MLDPNAIRERILVALPGSEVLVNDTTGTVSYTHLTLPTNREV